MHYNGAMKLRILLAALMTSLLMALSPVQAEDKNALSLDEAVAQAERQHDARAVKAEAKKRGDRTVYRIRLLTADGRVFDVTVDADNGAKR